MKSPTSRTIPALAIEDQPVSFAELFFDLVFVFSVTQVVHLLDHAFDWVHLGQAALVFWLVWWAWTQFTWALNAADTRHNYVRTATLIATAFAFFMAVAVPKSFALYSGWFAFAYVAVRIIGLLVYLWVAWPNTDMRSAVKSFGVLSITGMIAVIAGGVIGGMHQYWLWGLAILLDVMAATKGANKEGWGLHPRHFAERHGLFVIIALGETLIVAASGASVDVLDFRLIIVAACSVGITACLWWLYFYKMKDRLEHAIAHKKGSDQSSTARDVYSLLHFPAILGLVIYAYAIEQAMHHPGDALNVEGRMALAAGISLFTISTVAANWRAVGKILWPRILMSVFVSLSVIIKPGILSIRTLFICFTLLLLLCAIEERDEKEAQLD